NCSVFPINRHATYILRWAVVHYWRERCAVIVGVPKSAAGIAHIKLGWVVWVYGKIYHAAAHNCGANTFKSQIFYWGILRQFTFLLKPVLYRNSRCCWL